MPSYVNDIGNTGPGGMDVRVATYNDVRRDDDVDVLFVTRNGVLDPLYPVQPPTAAERALPGRLQGSVSADDLPLPVKDPADGTWGTVAENNNGVLFGLVGATSEDGLTLTRLAASEDPNVPISTFRYAANAQDARWRISRDTLGDQRFVPDGPEISVSRGGLLAYSLRIAEPREWRFVVLLHSLIRVNEEQKLVVSFTGTTARVRNLVPAQNPLQVDRVLRVEERWVTWTGQVRIKPNVVRDDLVNDVDLPLGLLWESSVTDVGRIRRNRALFFQFGYPSPPPAGDNMDVLRARLSRAADVCWLEDRRLRALGGSWTYLFPGDQLSVAEPEQPSEQLMRARLDVYRGRQSEARRSYEPDAVNNLNMEANPMLTPQQAASLVNADAALRLLPERSNPNGQLAGFLQNPEQVLAAAAPLDLAIQQVSRIAEVGFVQHRFAVEVGGDQAEPSRPVSMPHDGIWRAVQNDGQVGCIVALATLSAREAIDACRFASWVTGVPPLAALQVSIDANQEVSARALQVDPPAAGVPATFSEFGGKRVVHWDGRLLLFGPGDVGLTRRRARPRMRPLTEVEAPVNAQVVQDQGIPYLYLSLIGGNNQNWEYVAPQPQVGESTNAYERLSTGYMVNAVQVVNQPPAPPGGGPQVPFNLQSLFLGDGPPEAYQNRTYPNAFTDLPRNQLNGAIAGAAGDLSLSPDAEALRNSIPPPDMPNRQEAIRFALEFLAQAPAVIQPLAMVLQNGGQPVQIGGVQNTLARSLLNDVDGFALDLTPEDAATAILARTLHRFVNNLVLRRAIQGPPNAAVQFLQLPYVHTTQETIRARFLSNSQRGHLSLRALQVALEAVAPASQALRARLQQFPPG